MKKVSTLTKWLMIAIGTLCFASQTFAQFTLTGQYRTRTEFRDGQGTLPVKGAVPSFFTNSRLRLNVGLTADRFKFFASIQDIRVWGQDASTISNLDGNKLFMHEAWGEIQLNDSTFLKGIDYLGVKVGRQEIAYDDQKLLGALDWLPQARSHDAIVLKFAEKTWKADAGFAFNQNREIKNSGTVYTGVPTAQIGPDAVNAATGAGTNGIGVMYKAMQYGYISKEFGFTKAAFLLFNEDFQKPGTAPGTYKRGVYARTTAGISVYGTIMRKHKIDGGFYYQGNKDKVGKTMDGYMASLSTQFAVGRKLMTGPGADYLSGNNTLDSTSKVNRSFDPLYGTPHKFWGFMDYFYAADPYGFAATTGTTPGLNKQSPGLINVYWKSKYRLRDNLILTLDVHEFFAANKVADRRTSDRTDVMNSRLGTELDVVLNYNLTKAVGFELGYSVMFATESMAAMKAPGGVQKDLTGNWAYFMINIRPDFLNAINTSLTTMKKSIEESSKRINTIEAAQTPQN